MIRDRLSGTIRDHRHEIREWTKTLVFSVLLFFGLKIAVVEAYVIPTGSMRPTIHEGDRVLGSKFHYHLFEPARGEVVVFRPPEEVRAAMAEPVDRYVKRVVGIPGDLVEIRDGLVFVNGEALDEPYLADPPSYRMAPVRVPEGKLFVLGDNRDQSFDSHAWGFLDQDRLLARVFARYWPPNRLRGF
jgi:signal peptidase I